MSETKTCNLESCPNIFKVSEIVRQYGAFSSVAIGGFCNAVCHTEHHFPEAFENIKTEEEPAPKPDANELVDKAIAYKHVNTSADAVVEATSKLQEDIHDLIAAETDEGTVSALMSVHNALTGFINVCAGLEEKTDRIYRGLRKEMKP